LLLAKVYERVNRMEQAEGKLEWIDALPLPLLASVSWTADRLPYSAYGKNFLRLVSRRSAAGLAARITGGPISQFVKYC